MFAWNHRLIMFTMIFSLVFSPLAIAAGTTEEQERIQEVRDLIAEYHVDGEDLTKLPQTSMEDLLDATQDPHTDYFTEEEYMQFIDSVEGSYSGIGMLVGQNETGIFVHQVFEGSPAKQEGIQPGDQIVSVNGETIQGQSIEAVVTKIKGKPGTKVNITLMRDGRSINVNVTRQDIELPVVSAELLDHQIGYIELATFSNHSTEQFKAELIKLHKQDLKGLIIDLRNNPGGLLDSALQISSFFIEEGPIVHVKNNKGQDRTYRVKGGYDWDLPLVVLVNGYSASASEILTAALKDYEKATIIGTQTFGKGTVQELIPLRSGGMLKLTIEEYFTPDHHVINHVGVPPHLLVTNPQEQLQAAKLYLQGNHSLRLTSKGSILINGHKDQSEIATAIKQDGKWYISLRKAAALFKGQVGYDSELKKATLQIGSQKNSYELRGNPGLLVKEGTSYLQLDQLLKQYPQLKKVSNLGDIVLTLK
jgi:carboxyl-terminal processing protease